MVTQFDYMKKNKYILTKKNLYNKNKSYMLYYNKKRGLIMDWYVHVGILLIIIGIVIWLFIRKQYILFLMTNRKRVKEIQ